MVWGSFQKQKNLVPLQPWSFTSDQAAPYLQLFFFVCLFLFLLFLETVWSLGDLKLSCSGKHPVMGQARSWHPCQISPGFTFPILMEFPTSGICSQSLYERYQHQAPTWLLNFFPPRSCRWVKCFLGVVEVISESCISGSWREAGRGCV